MITDVQRIVVKRDNTEIKTNTLILTFNTPKIPDSLKMCYLNIPVSQYVPNPIGWYKCQRFGHVTSKCKHNEVCARWSATVHKDDTCTKEHKCVNCEENHASYNKKCSFINESMIFSIWEYHRMYLFLKLVQFIKKTHGQRVMKYAGTPKAPIQCTSVCTQTVPIGPLAQIAHGYDPNRIILKSVSMTRWHMSHFHSRCPKLAAVGKQ